MLPLHEQNTARSTGYNTRGLVLFYISGAGQGLVKLVG
jgi:hypothetical protein